MSKQDSAMSSYTKNMVVHIGNDEVRYTIFEPVESIILSKAENSIRVITKNRSYELKYSSLKEVNVGYKKIRKSVDHQRCTLFFFNQYLQYAQRLQESQEIVYEPMED